MTEQEFVESVVHEGGDYEAAFLIRNHLLDWIYVEKFTPYPEDDLRKVYGIDEDELNEDLILRILNSLHIEPPSLNELLPHGIVRSPLDVARLISRARLNES